MTVQTLVDPDVPALHPHGCISMECADATSRGPVKSLNSSPKLPACSKDLPLRKKWPPYLNIVNAQSLSFKSGWSVGMAASCLLEIRFLIVTVEMVTGSTFPVRQIRL